MKVIIAGGRKYQGDYVEDFELLDKFRKENMITEVVSGGQSGADELGERWGRLKHLQVKRFPANWQKYGKAAGPIRNKAMAEYADAVILFPGGAGTHDMFKKAKEYGLKIIYNAGGEE